MKTIIINGSPRTDGSCASVISYIKTQLDCDVLNCVFDAVAHCSGCDVCKNGTCIIDDKMQDHYKSIEKADNIVFISPLYFSMLTGGLLTFASRWQYFYNNPLKGERKGAVLLLGGGSTKDTSKAFDTAKIIMRYAGVKSPACAAFVGTDKKAPLENPDFKAELDNIIKYLKSHSLSKSSL